MKPIQQKIFDISVDVTCIGVLTKLISFKTDDDDIKEILEKVGNVCMVAGTIGAFSQCGKNIKDALIKLVIDNYGEV